MKTQVEFRSAKFQLFARNRGEAHRRRHAWCALLLAALVAGGCQHALSPEQVRAELERRERAWRTELSARYDLIALHAFVRGTIMAQRTDRLPLATRTLNPDWTIGGNSLVSGDWYFNSWNIADDTFTLHTDFPTEKKRVQFKCVRLSRTSFKLVEVVVETMRDELVS